MTKQIAEEAAERVKSNFRGWRRWDRVPCEQAYTRFRFDGVVICLREHLPDSSDDDTTTGYEVAIMGPRGYEPLLAIDDREKWDELLGMCARHKVDLREWSKEPMPDNVIEAYMVCNLDEIEHWPVVVF